MIVPKPLIIAEFHQGNKQLSYILERYVYTHTPIGLAREKPQQLCQRFTACSCAGCSSSPASAEIQQRTAVLDLTRDIRARKQTQRGLPNLDLDRMVVSEAAYGKGKGGPERSSVSPIRDRGGLKPRPDWLVTVGQGRSPARTLRRGSRGRRNSKSSRPKKFDTVRLSFGGLEQVCVRFAGGRAGVGG